MISPCPICNRESQKAFHPFCSKRCADLDLGNWLGGRYRIPSIDEDEIPSDKVEDHQKEQDAP